MNNDTIAFQYKTNGSITLFVNNQLVTLDKTAMNYELVLAALKHGDYDYVRRNMNVGQVIADHTDGKVEIFGDDVYVNKQIINSAIAKRVVAVFRDNGLNASPIFRVLENIDRNPSEVSRNELYLFFEQNELPFTPEGHFLAYKIVNPDYTDCYTGTIDNHIGCSPAMNRDDVDHVRDNVCSRGFHFCSYSYLPQAYFLKDGRHLMVVDIDPANVVSIPSDYNNAKGRCWTYTVVGEINEFADLIPKGFTSEYSDDFKDDVFEDDLFEDDVEPVESAELDDVQSNYTEGQASNYKLDAQKVRDIRRLAATGDWSIAGIARLHNISPRQVGRILNRQCWSHVD